MKSFLGIVIVSTMLIATTSFAQVRFVESKAPVFKTTQPQAAQKSIADAQSKQEDPKIHFIASHEDQTVRQVIARWAGMAGWSFSAEHWTVDRDFPVVGSSDLGANFVDAVRALLLSTELTDLHVQPCFYTNRVVRVVLASEACSRSN